MTSSPIPFRFPDSLMGLAVLAGLVAPAAAQSLAGSETTTALALGTLTAGGASAGLLVRAEGGLGQVACGAPMSSESHSLLTGVVWSEPVLASDSPVVLGVLPGAGSKSGGDAVTVVGLNFDAPGAGAADVLFDGAFGSSALVTGPNTISVQTPPGVDPVGNPLAAVPVRVSNALGTYEAADAFDYFPSLAQHSAAYVGRTFELSLRMEPGSLYFLAFGSTLPGLAAPIAPFDGALTLLGSLSVLENGAFSPTGWEKLPVAVPDLPTFAGLTFDFQMLALSDLGAPAGAFSNTLSVTPLP